MVEPYENNGMISLRVGVNLKGALEEAGRMLMDETGQPSLNAALVHIIREKVLSHRAELSKRATFNLLFDQMPRAGRK